MLSQVQSALSKMLSPGEPLLAGVSGGADSVVLLDALVKLGWPPHVCHLNHQLRGADSDADAEFVRQLAARYGLPCTIESVSNAARPQPNQLSFRACEESQASGPDDSRDSSQARNDMLCDAVINISAKNVSEKHSNVEGASTPTSGRPESPHRGGDAAPTWKGLEDAARQARFAFFESVAARTGIHKIALAHTADDQVETFLLHLLRGAGVAGLAGIWPERPIGTLRVIRPFLAVTRAEVLEYLTAQGLSYREDATNRDTTFLRNRIRHELLPLLERRYNAGIRDVLRRTAEILRDEDEFLTALAAAADRSRLWAEPVALQRRVLRLWLGQGLDFEHIEAVRQLSPAAEVTLPGGLIVYRDGDALRKATRQELAPVRGRWPLNLSGETVIGELHVRFHAEIVSAAALPKLCNNCYTILAEGLEQFDLEALGDAPFVRTWQEGDRFQPLGMTGEKRLQDFFVDEKVPRPQRGRIPLLCAADGRIAWVVGYRIAEPFKVTGRTSRLLRIQREAL